MIRFALGRFTLSIHTWDCTQRNALVTLYGKKPYRTVHFPGTPRRYVETGVCPYRLFAIYYPNWFVNWAHQLCN